MPDRRSTPVLVRPAWAYLWASPTSLLGLVPAIVGRLTGGRWRRRDGVLEACGGLLPALLRYGIPMPGGAQALALGHVVLGRDEACLDRLGPHEHEHVRQAERWGPFFVPAYLGIGLWLWLTGRRPYHDHPFEVAARAAARAALPWGPARPRLDSGA